MYKEKLKAKVSYPHFSGFFFFEIDLFIFERWIVTEKGRNRDALLPKFTS